MEIEPFFHSQKTIHEKYMGNLTSDPDHGKYLQISLLFTHLENQLILYENLGTFYWQLKNTENIWKSRSIFCHLKSI